MKKYQDLATEFDKNQEILNPITRFDYESKGVLFSEVAFIFLVLNNINFNKFIESGRARAQSTELLASLYPGKNIVTIEYDKESPDNQIANNRLSKYQNVKTVYGDSFKVLPKILEENDVVFIDGPKMFQAIILAFQILKTKKVKYVFVHDMFTGSNERWFIDGFTSNSLHSDNMLLAKSTKVLDEKVRDGIPTKMQFDENKEFGYGYNITAIEYNSNASYSLKIIFAIFFDYYFRIIRRLGF